MHNMPSLKSRKFYLKIFLMQWKLKELLDMIKIIFLGSKARPARKAHNLTAIFEPTV
jgi:hypothetical protein